MLWSVIRLISKTSSVTPDFFYVFNIILSFSTCRQSFKKICTWELLGANVLKLILDTVSTPRAVKITTLVAWMFRGRRKCWTVHVSKIASQDWLFPDSFWSLKWFFLLKNNLIVITLEPCKRLVGPVWNLNRPIRIRQAWKTVCTDIKMV